MRRFTCLLGFACALVSVIATPGLAEAEFAGWQAIRVIEQDGRPGILRAADVNGDGRDEAIVVNTRLSRLDIYRWVPPAERDSKNDSAGNSTLRSNELPMASELSRDEVQLEHLPRDLVVQDLDGDSKPELIVLVAPPNRILVLSQNDKQAWEEKYRIDLFEGELSPRRRPLLMRRLPNGSRQLMVSFADGIQLIDLQANGRSAWMTPREKQNRSAWWLADLDRDGDLDLVEQTRKASESIRWYEASQDGQLLPAQALFDRATGDVEVLEDGESTELVLMDSRASGIVRRYRLGEGAESELGSARTMTLIGENNSVWCGMRQGDRTALVVSDPNRPRLLSYELADDGWQAEESFPSIGGVQTMVAPVAAPGTLLLQTKDGADLFRCTWNDRRLTYPKAWAQSTDEDDRQVITLQQIGGTTWWVQRVGSDLHLYRWNAAADGQTNEPQLTKMAKVGKSATEALWIGGDRLLVKNKHARGLRLVELKDGKALSKELANLKKADLSEFRLYSSDGKFRLARFADGVLQWLDDDLQSFDQIMLPDGREMAAFVPVGSNGGWGLEKGSEYVHQLEADEAGVVRSITRTRVGSGQSLTQDAVLGLLLVNRDRVTHLSAGVPRRLTLIGSIDRRVGREGGIRETRIHRIMAADLDGDAIPELLLFDDMEHRIAALANHDGIREPLLTWQVFDDKIYPYSDEQSNLVKEPRAVCGLDIDGDDQTDLVMLCHDRLVVYLGRSE